MWPRRKPSSCLLLLLLLVVVVVVLVVVVIVIIINIDSSSSSIGSQYCGWCILLLSLFNFIIFIQKFDLFSAECCSDLPKPSHQQQLITLNYSFCSVGVPQNLLNKESRARMNHENRISFHSSKYSIYLYKILPRSCKNVYIRSDRIKQQLHSKEDFLLFSLCSCKNHLKQINISSLHANQEMISF